MHVILGFVLGSRVIFSDQKERQNQHCFGFTPFSRYPHTHVTISVMLLCGVYPHFCKLHLVKKKVPNFVTGC